MKLTKSPLVFLKSLILNAGLVFLSSSALSGNALAQEDPFLIQAFEGVWKMERSATTLVADTFNTQVENGILRYESSVKEAPIYLRESYEVGQIEYRRKKYSAKDSQWGSFPQLNPDTLRLIEISIPQTRYLILSGQGESIFSSTPFQRFRFHHVFDMGRGRQITNYYPVFSDAYLGERVLGRLPNSPVLNFARVVPSQWDANNKTIGYEVLLYDLDRKGMTRTLDNSAPLAYALTKNADSPLWTLAPISSTPVADELDRKGHFFTGARLPATEYNARQLAATEIKAKSSKRTKKKSNKKTSATKPIQQKADSQKGNIEPSISANQG